MNDLIGQTLGLYHLESLLGSSGISQVYHGVNCLVDRPTAVKVMQVSTASHPLFRTRFLQETEAAAALHHPNIVEIYEFGEQDGVLFLVMELMDGGSLNFLLRMQHSQPLPLPLALDLGSQIAQGLAAAHAKQVVHGDIKPANLLLQWLPEDQDKFVIKIKDFGLARLLEGGSETLTGTPMGTLAYLSPEQCAGRKQLDGRSDLYALGVVLYEMVTGSQPFQMNGVNDAVYKHTHVPPPPPRQIRPDLPPAVEEIILRCLAKRPDERFASGTALSQALQQVLDGSDNSLMPNGQADWLPTQSHTSPVARASEVEPVSLSESLPQIAALPSTHASNQDAGQETRVPPGQEQRVTFQLHAGPVGKPPTQTVPGKFVNFALVPAWVLPAFLALVLVAAVGVSGLLGWLPPPGQTDPATSTAGLTKTPVAGVTPSSPNTSSTGITIVQQPTIAPTASAPDVSPTASVSPSPSRTAYPGQRYMRSAQMANGVDSQTLQPQQPTNTFNVGSRMYAVFTLHPPIQGGTVCSSWYLNGSQIADVSLSMSGDSPGGYIYVIYNSPGMAYVELYWASDTTCADKTLAQHLNFTVTAS